MSIDILLPNGVQMQGLVDKPVQFQSEEDEISCLIDPVVGKVTVQSDASVSLYGGASALSGRTKLRIMNTSDDISVRIGPSSITQKKGYLLEPRGVLVVTFDSAQAVPMYGRSCGYEVELEVMES